MKIKDLEKNFNSFSQFVDWNFDKLFRMWYKNEEKNSLGANYIYITGCIPIPNDIMLIVRFYDDVYKDKKYPSLEMIKLSEISLAYYEDDQEEEEDEDEDKPFV